MVARRINNQWHVDIHIPLADGTRKRVRRKSPFRTKRATLEYERELVSEITSSSSEKKRV